MNRRLLAAACASALCAQALASPARHIKLDGAEHEGSVRFLTSLHVTLEEGKRTSWVTVTRTGTFTDPRYGNFAITRPMLLAMVKNFEARVYAQDIFIDVAHRPDDGAAAKVLKLAVEGDRLRALVEWTDFGMEAVKKRGFTYLSAEYHEDWRDNEKGEQHGPVLLGAGLTVRPVVKGLDPIRLSESDDVPLLIHPELQTKLLQEIQTMWKELIERLRQSLGAHKLSEAHAKAIVTQAEAALGKITEKPVAEAVTAAFEGAGKQLAEAIAAGQSGEIKLSIAVPDAFKGGLTEDQVKKLMEDMGKAKAEAEKKVNETQAARRKLLADTIAAAQGLADEDKKQLVEAVQDLVSAEMSEDTVKRLAATQITQGNKLAAARQLAASGYQLPEGSVVISVDASNEIKALQEEVDKRLYSRMPAHRRYALSEGKPIDGNKEIVEQALKIFDADPRNARRLHQEYKGWKQLAAGDGLVSDVAVPATFERTVIREALYQMVGLQLCDVGTAQFSAVHQLPYSFRDTTAAGKSQARKYEGQSIARAGVKQLLEETRPIPQKIAFEVSDELRYLIGNGQINFDIVAENARNASRIIGEDTEQLVFDAHLNAADQAFTTDVVAEAVAAGDGVKTIFVLDQFPVVRPVKVFDLQGNQVGNTLYPITVTVNAVERPEYDGTGTQAPGVYWTINYNLGELTFVNETGVPTAVVNTHAIVATYTYTTNVFKWDSDLGGLKIDEKYDDFLYRFGLRKALVEDRAYMANLAIMSGTLRTQIEQARQFGANFKRAGTDLMADGNLGRIKDIPSFRSYAPGLAIGDQRTVICERGTVRFRMMKPWTMGMLENQKDANGRFTGKKEAYGDQFIVVHTPLELKKAFTSMVVYSATARVDR